MLCGVLCLYRLMVHKRLSSLTSAVALVALRRHVEPIKAEVSEWLSLHLQVYSAAISTAVMCSCTLQCKRF